MSGFYETAVYREISARLAAFYPPIIVKDHVDPDGGIKPKAGWGTLEGITFKPKDADALIEAFRKARSGGDTAFAEGSSFDVKHWALRMSFAATKGAGFREIWRPRLSDRPLDFAEARPNRFRPSWDDRGSGRFGDSLVQQDVSSIHCAVADEVCNIHIDQTGFVMTGPSGDLEVNPDALRHMVVELFYKTTAKEALGLPASFVDRFYPIMPSTANSLSIGFGLDAVKAKTYKLTFSGTCALHGAQECSVTATLSGTHELGTAPVRRPPRRW